ncbi:nucleotidyltransferase family protein [Nocardia sp. N13]|uniref:nucleotidyltransferase family protein n=1 Tax=Nocardioides sp. N13(2025) TaxID=3453405 RepID=UPI003F75C219
MVGENVMILSEIATQIVTAVPDGELVSIEEVTASVVAAFGEPEPPTSAARLTLNKMHELASHSILVLDDGTETLTSTGSTSPTAVDALRAALRHIRSSDSSLWRLPSGVRDPHFVAAAKQHHVVSYLDRHAARLALPPGLAAAISVSAAQRVAAVEILSTELAHATRALEGADIRVLVFKGMALASQAHGDIAARGAGDLDLLVAPEDLEKAHGVLTSTRWTHDPHYPHPGPTWAWRHMKRTGYEITLYGRSTIDLHWRLTPSAGTFPPFDILWERRAAIRVADREVHTLSPYDALAHSASHAAKDEWRWMRSLVDVHVLASDQAVWRRTTHPLRGDQLISLGLAARMFGVPEGAPRVVHDAVKLTDAVWGKVLAGQLTTFASHDARPTLGASLASSLRTLRRTGAAHRDIARALAFSACPPWMTAQESSRYAVIAAPRVLWRRSADVARRLTNR